MFLFAVAILTCVIAGLWIYARWNHGILETMGIPIVKYTNPILGSIREEYDTVGGYNDIKRMKEYGHIYGVYEGRQHTVHICNPDLARLICVKHSDHFNSRRDLKFGDALLDEMPDFMETKKWKVVRSLTSPAFSSAKIKMMNLPMREATSDFIANIKERIIKSEKHCVEKFALDTELSTMYTDLVGRCIFSLIFKYEQDEFSKMVKKFLELPNVSPQSQKVTLYTHVFPIIKKFRTTPMFDPKLARKFVQLFKQLLEERKHSEKRNDVVSLCIDWFEKLDSEEFKQVGINEMTLIAQPFSFLFAAQDQISFTVAQVVYHMSQDADLERRIYEEVDEVFAKHGKIGHEHLPELHLLQSCMQECIRLYPVFHRLERLCTKDWRNEEFQLEIKKGTVVYFPLWALNRNPEYLENANEFVADRFLKGDKDKMNAYTTSSFGFGPRMCPGKRFAMEAIGVILAYILKEFKFVKRVEYRA